MKISVNMILGNRPEPYLEYALKSVLWADEFIIVNSGDHKSDNIERAKKILKDKAFVVMDYCILGKDFDFASARNMALEASTGDFILKVDADEVYYNSFENTVRHLGFNADIYQVEFYHFMLDVFHYQYIEKKQVLFKRDKFRWSGKTHEILEPIDMATIMIIKLQDKFCHFGYAQSQEKIFDKWQQYVNIEGRSEWYKGQDPKHILDDRASVSKEFEYEYPEAIRDEIINFPHVIKGDEVKSPMPKVGVIALTENDNVSVVEQVKEIEDTADVPVMILIIAKDCSGDFILKLQGRHPIFRIENVTKAEALNAGINHIIKTDPDVRWIGMVRNGRISMAVDLLNKGTAMVGISGYGQVISVDLFEKIGLYKNVDCFATEFLDRAIKNNFKVEQI